MTLGRNMKSGHISASEKALIEREFVYKQQYEDRKRRNLQWLFFITLVVAFTAAASFRIERLYPVYIISRILSVIGTLGFLIYLGSSAPYSSINGNRYITNPWEDALQKIKEPRHIIQAASLLAAFPVFRMAFAFIREIF